MLFNSALPFNIAVLAYHIKWTLMTAYGCTHGCDLSQQRNKAKSAKVLKKHMEQSLRETRQKLQGSSPNGDTRDVSPQQDVAKYVKCCQPVNLLDTQFLRCLMRRAINVESPCLACIQISVSKNESSTQHKP